MKKKKEIVVSDEVIATIKEALAEKKEWVRKVQSGQVTYTKGKKIA